MKIELIHLAPYRPYGLKFIMTTDYLDEFGHYNDWGGNENDYKKGSIWTYSGEIDADLYIPLGDGDISRVFRKENTYISINCNGIKPILRPLSDFGGKMSAKDVMNELNCDMSVVHQIWDLLSGSLEIDSTSVRAYKVMCKNHIDFNKLIPKGLAIDKNTLK